MTSLGDKRAKRTGQIQIYEQTAPAFPLFFLRGNDCFSGICVCALVEKTIAFPAPGDLGGHRQNHPALFRKFSGDFGLFPGFFPYVIMTFNDG
jgi:hypothetical protein